MTKAGKRAKRRIAAPKKHLWSTARAAGRYTLEEIFSQPAIWAETARQLEQQGTLGHVSKIFSAESPWLFVACGSSYYVSQLVAAVWAKYFLIPCTAVPASEFLFAPSETLRRTGAQQAVLVSRSGETTDLRAAELLKSHAEIRTLGVTCNASGPLEKLCTQTMKLTWADEKSTVMRSSDLLIEMGLDEPEFARMAAMAIPAHLLRVAVGLRKGLNPDALKNLSRAVMLGTDGGGSAERISA